MGQGESKDESAAAQQQGDRAAVETTWSADDSWSATPQKSPHRGGGGGGHDRCCGYETASEGRRVAVIGGGVAGLAATWHLKKVATAQTNGSPMNNNNSIASVHLMEASSRVGGHAWTVSCHVQDNDTTTTTTTATTAGSTVVPVDIGFMVYNTTNYPNLVAWFSALNDTRTNDQQPLLQSEASNMSLSVSLETASKKHVVEWSSDLGLWQGGWYRGMLPQLWHLSWRLGLYSMWRMVREIGHFHATAARSILSLSHDDPRRHVTMAEYLRHHGYCHDSPFVTYYLYPMMAALWSASLSDVMDFPAAQCIAFLCHHQMLQVTARPVWQTVADRSTTYVEAAVRDIGDKAIYCDTPIHALRQLDNGTYQLLLLHTTTNSNHGGEVAVVPVQNNADKTPLVFDEVIFACHTDQTAAILQRSQWSAVAVDEDLPQEVAAATSLLQRMDYADNVIYVHSDKTLMPRNQRTWASWNCLGKSPAQQLVRATSTTTTTTNALSSNDQDGAEAVHLEPHQKLEGPNGRFKAVYVT
jgi:predicted NAD/FAD-binding protein